MHIERTGSLDAIYSFTENENSIRNDLFEHRYVDGTCYKGNWEGGNRNGLVCLLLCVQVHVRDFSILSNGHDFLVKR